MPYPQCSLIQLIHVGYGYGIFWDIFCTCTAIILWWVYTMDSHARTQGTQILLIIIFYFFYCLMDCHDTTLMQQINFLLFNLGSCLQFMGSHLCTVRYFKQNQLVSKTGAEMYTKDTFLT